MASATTVVSIRPGPAQGTVLAEAGSLDPTFGEGGIVSLDLGRGYDEARALALRVDGSIYLGGDYFHGFALARYRPNGVPDPTFGDRGAVTFPERNGSISSILVAADGGAFVTGPSDAGSVLRIQPDGTLDPTFGDGGRVETGIQYLQHLAMSEDGIIVGGEDYRHYLGHDESDLVLIRLELDGSIDPDFGDGGTVRLPNRFPGGVTALATQADGTIVATSSSRGRLLVLRFTPEGRLDRSFGGRGLVSPAGRFGIPHAVVVDPEGNITVGGSEFTRNGDGDLLLLRLDSLGERDRGFGNEGRVHLDLIGGDDVADSLVLRPDGRLIAAGSFEDPSTNASGSLVAGFNADGSLDGSFGDGGIFTEDRLAAAADVVVEPGGRMVAAGGAGGDHAMIRILPDGTLDRSFGENGWVARNYGFGIDQLGDVAVQPDGKIVAVGYDDRGSFVLRFDRDGQADATFGVGGVAYLDRPIDPFGDPLQGAVGLALQGDGSILVGGDWGEAFGLVRVSSAGDLDRSFGEDGVASASFRNRYATLYAIASQPDGMIIAAGQARGPRGVVSALARFDPDGHPDLAFGHAGKVTTVHGANGIVALEIQPDGRLVGAGWAPRGFAVARYSTDGSLDPSFDGDGVLVTKLGHGSGASALTIQPDGRIVAAGLSTTSGSSSFALARYRSDGSLDRSFGQGGVVTTDMGRGSERISDLAVAPEGGLIAVGGGRDEEGAAVAIARYGADGSLDLGFGDTGRVYTQLGKGSEWGYAVALGPDGRFVVVGLAHRDSLLCRYIA